ncbi:MAG: S26 family signal peptidase [Frankiales bacterium]|nr:S26 family signal peptidase [Frankiales bacterium]
MAPALRDGDQLLVVRVGRRRPPREGDVVLVELPDRPLAVKRVRRLDASGIWVEGDNPDGSTDSRTLGALAAEAVVGRVLARLWPRPGHVPPSH